MPAISRFALPVVAVCLLSVTACVPRPVATGNGEERSSREEVDLSEYEDFDPASYREEAPAQSNEDDAIEHDVPGRLLSGSAGAGVERTMQGFRVQVLSSKDQRAAEDAATAAQEWWDENGGSAPGDLFAVDEGEELPVYTVYRQPYYRVRVGNFTDRAEAERALAFLQERYGDAFIARSEVTVTQ